MLKATPHAHTSNSHSSASLPTLPPLSIVSPVHHHAPSPISLLTSPNSSTTSNFAMRIIIRGDRETGKSSLFRRLQNNTYVESYTPTPCIQGASIQWTYKTSNESVAMEVWDVVDKALPNVAAINAPPAGPPNRPPAKLPLDASSCNVYANVSAVIICVNPARPGTFEYAKKEMEHIPTNVETVLLINFRDLPASQRILTDEEVTTFVKSQGPHVRSLSGSMKNGFGMRVLSSFLNVPYLKMRIAEFYCLIAQSKEDLNNAQTEVELLIESVDYDSHCKLLGIQVQAQSSKAELERKAEEDKRAQAERVRLQLAKEKEEERLRKEGAKADEKRRKEEEKKRKEDAKKMKKGGNTNNFAGPPTINGVVIDKEQEKRMLASDNMDDFVAGDSIDDFFADEEDTVRDLDAKEKQAARRAKNDSDDDALSESDDDSDANLKRKKKMMLQAEDDTDEDNDIRAAPYRPPEDLLEEPEWDDDDPSATASPFGAGTGTNLEQKAEEALQMSNAERELVRKAEAKAKKLEEKLKPNREKANDEHHISPKKKKEVVEEDDDESLPAKDPLPPVGQRKQYKFDLDDDDDVTDDSDVITEDDEDFAVVKNRKQVVKQFSDVEGSDLDNDEEYQPKKKPAKVEDDDEPFADEDDLDFEVPAETEAERQARIASEIRKERETMQLKVRSQQSATSSIYTPPPGAEDIEINLDPVEEPQAPSRSTIENDINIDLSGTAGSRDRKSGKSKDSTKSANGKGNPKESLGGFYSDDEEDPPRRKRSILESDDELSSLSDEDITPAMRKELEKLKSKRTKVITSPTLSESEELSEEDVDTNLPMSERIRRVQESAKASKEKEKGKSRNQEDEDLDHKAKRKRNDKEKSRDKDKKEKDKDRDSNRKDRDRKEKKKSSRRSKESDSEQEEIRSKEKDKTKKSKSSRRHKSDDEDEDRRNRNKEKEKKSSKDKERNGRDKEKEKESGRRKKNSSRRHDSGSALEELSDSDDFGPSHKSLKSTRNDSEDFYANDAYTSRNSRSSATAPPPVESFQNQQIPDANNATVEKKGGFFKRMLTRG